MEEIKLYPFSLLLKRILKFLSTTGANDIKGKLIWLSDYK